MKDPQTQPLGKEDANCLDWSTEVSLATILEYAGHIIVGNTEIQDYCSHWCCSHHNWHHLLRIFHLVPVTTSLLDCGRRGLCGFWTWPCTCFLSWLCGRMGFSGPCILSFSTLEGDEKADLLTWWCWKDLRRPTHIGEAEISSFGLNLKGLCLDGPEALRRGQRSRKWRREAKWERRCLRRDHRNG